MFLFLVHDYRLLRGTGFTVEPQRRRFKPSCNKRSIHLCSFCFSSLLNHSLYSHPPTTYTQPTLTTRKRTVSNNSTTSHHTKPQAHTHSYIQNDFNYRRLVQSLSRPPQPNPSLTPLHGGSHPKRTGTPFYSFPLSPPSSPASSFFSVCVLVCSHMLSFDDE